MDAAGEQRDFARCGVADIQIGVNHVAERYRKVCKLGLKISLMDYESITQSSLVSGSSLSIFDGLDD